jgi:hypothetical protein
MSVWVEKRRKDKGKAHLLKGNQARERSEEREGERAKTNICNQKILLF